MPERTLKITCDECGYSEEVPESKLAYEEAKTCPSCRKSKMWWVPPAEEARKREVRRAMPEGKPEFEFPLWLPWEGPPLPRDISSPWPWYKG